MTELCFAETLDHVGVCPPADIVGIRSVNNARTWHIESYIVAFIR